MNRYILTIALAAIILMACQSKESQTSSPSAIDSDAASEDVAICMWKELAVKESPSEKGKYVTSVYLGEKITVLDDTVSEVSNGKKTTYINVELIDGTKGWLRSDLISVNSVPLSFTRESLVYKRPDLMTPTTKQFQPLDFVVAKSVLDNGWVEVTGKRVGDSWFTTGWVRNENLVKGEQDVAFAVFYNRAMENKDLSKRDAEIQNLLANRELSSSVFFTMLTEKMQSADDDVETMEPVMVDSAVAQ